MPNEHRILLVDDNATNLAILEEMLEDDYQIATSASGEEALALAPEFEPSLILLDVMMPGMDGYETCRRLRTHGALRHTKVIMVSAKAMVSERIEGYKAGADDYVTKPFDQEELLAKVKVYLRLKSMEEVDQLKSELLRWLCYETRTPLSGILAPAQVMVEEFVDADEQQQYLEMIYQSAVRLHNLIEKVILLSEMKASRLEFKFQVASISSVLQAAVRAVTDYAAESQVQIVQDDLDINAIQPLRMDVKRMETVIETLLQYAVRLSPMDSCVRVTLREEDDRLCLMVSDEGEGIEPGLLSHIFDEFAQADGMLLTEGQGLSLAIAREIVLAHDGTVSAENMPDAGTTFTLTLPRLPSE